MWAWVVSVRTLLSVLALIKYCWVAKVQGKLFYEKGNYTNLYEINLKVLEI